MKKHRIWQVDDKKFRFPAIEHDSRRPTSITIRNGFGGEVWVDVKHIDRFIAGLKQIKKKAQEPAS